MLLNRLPKIDLCYEKFLHNKVHSDEYMLIPKGKRSLLWFTYEDEKNICLILYLDNNNRIIKQEKHISCFSSNLVNGSGTILYGVMFNTNNKKFSKNNFAVINIHYLEGINVYKTMYKEKVKLFLHLFNNISQNSINKLNLLIGMPIITNNYLKILNDVSYSINCIKPINFKLYNLNLNFKIKNNKAVFYVVADIEPDIYILTCENDKTFNRIAYIPNYNNSVMMNKLFRNIKENENLDLLEESDSENEFQNIDDCKFIIVNKQLKMECEFNRKFKKWVPIKVDTINEVSKKNYITEIEK